MPDMEVAFREQKALLWELEGHDAYGQPTRSDTATELDVRWVRDRAKMLDPQGNTVTVDATVVVDRDIAVGSLLWEGSLDDLAEATTGTGTGSDLIPEDNIMQVVTASHTKDLKGRAIRRTLGVKRWGNTMPTAGA